MLQIFLHLELSGMLMAQKYFEVIMVFLYRINNDFSFDDDTAKNYECSYMFISLQVGMRVIGPLLSQTGCIHVGQWARCTSI